MRRKKIAANCHGLLTLSIFGLALLLATSKTAAFAQAKKEAKPPAPIAAPSFEKDVLPILTNSCLGCHGGLRKKGELDLRTSAAILKGGESGTAVHAGKPEQSLLWQKIAKGEMPKEGKLSDSDKQIIHAWIAAKLPSAPKLNDVKAQPSKKPRDPLQVAAALDQAISRQLTEAKKLPAPLAADAEFLRRVSLDITGRLPTPAAARAFLASSDRDKRRKLIDALLSEPDFGKHWGTLWHNQLVPVADGKRTYDEPFLNWLAKSFTEDIGWDKTVTELLCAQGAKPEAPQVGFLVANPGADKTALQASRLFLGVNLECAECHNHPMVRWQQAEYWGLAAFFSRVVRTPAKGPIGVLVDEREGKPLVARKGQPPLKGAGIVIPASALTNAGNVVKARFLDGPEVDVPAIPYRPTLAAWITSPENRFFGPAFANRTWAQFMGRGLIEPLDEFHEGNPPTHPEVLAALAHEFRVSGHNVKHLIRCICNTQAYQRTSRAEAEDEAQLKLFGRMPVRLLSPEVLYTLIGQVLGVKDLKLNDPLATTVGKNVLSRTPRTVFVNSFPVVDGDPDPLTYTHGVLQVLRLLNQPELNQGGTTAKALAANSKLTPAQALDDMYLLALTRQPTAVERDRLIEYMGRQGGAQEGYAAVLWMLLNYREFVLNH